MYNINVQQYYQENRKYDMARFMRYDNELEFYDILDSGFIKVLPFMSTYGVKTVTIEEGKPSLLCESIYGYFNTQYWWILMEINNFTDASDLKAGTQVIYPSISSLDTFFGQLNPKNN